MQLSKFTNAFGTITGVLTVISTLMIEVLKCTPATDLAPASCAVSWLPPSLAMWAAGIFGVLTLVLKAARPGGFLHSLFGSTAVVVPETNPKSGPGTVTPEQVAQP